MKYSPHRKCSGRLLEKSRDRIVTRSKGGIHLTVKKYMVLRFRGFGWIGKSLVCNNVVITQNIGISSYPYRHIDLHKLIFL